MSYQPRRRRGVAVLAALLLGGGLFAALLIGLYTRPMRPGQAPGLALFSVAPPPPPPPPERTRPHPVFSRHPAGRAAPAGLRARPTDLVVPPPIVPPPLPPPPVTVALVAGPGSASHAGNSTTPGPGPGAGGQGDGSGSGGDGDGEGDGGDTPPRWRHGELKMRDWPESLGPVREERSVHVRYTVDERGRVPDCSVTQSSGLPLLDQTTCDLIKQRFRFSPSRDAAGRPVSSTIVETHSWVPRPGDQ